MQQPGTDVISGLNIIPAGQYSSYVVSTATISKVKSSYEQLLYVYNCVAFCVSETFYKESDVHKNGRRSAKALSDSQNGEAKPKVCPLRYHCTDLKGPIEM